jgi:Zn-dependent protease
MSSAITHSVIRNCPNCETETQLGSVACAECHTLLYGNELQSLAQQAQKLEAAGDAAQARELWNRSLSLLPPESRQATWVREKMQALESNKPAAPKPTPAWVKKLGPFGPLALLLLKGKTLIFALFKLKFLFSFIAFAWIYAVLFGWRFGVGFAVALLIHEMGHYIDIRRRGLQAELPVFLPGLGAFVRWTGTSTIAGQPAPNVSRRQRAQVALAGPLAGWIAAAVCFLIYTKTIDPLWAALARTISWMNIMNLIPIWILDGSRAMDALDRVERSALLALTLTLWFFTGEGVFLLVAAGITYRLFTRDRPPKPSWNTWAYYAAVLIALSVVLHFVPNSLVQPGSGGRGGF